MGNGMRIRAPCNGSQPLFLKGTHSRHPWPVRRVHPGFLIKVDFWVKFHRNLAGELPLLMNAVRLREAPTPQRSSPAPQALRSTLPSVRLLRRRLYAVDSQIQSQFRFDAPPISLFDIKYCEIRYKPNCTL